MKSIKQRWKCIGWIYLISVIVFAHAAVSAQAAEKGSGTETADVQAAQPQQASVEVGNEAPPTKELEQKMKQQVSFSFTAAGLGDVLTSIAQSYDLNILPPADLSGTVTINLKDVTLDEALHSVLEQNGYTYLWERNVIKVKKKEEAVVSRVISVSYVKLDTAYEVVQKLASEAGSLRLNEANNEILATDKIANVEKMENAVAKLDTAPLQILIQTQILDMTFTDLKSMGFTLSGTVDTKRLIKLGGPGEGRTTTIASTLANPTTDLPSGQFTATVQLDEGGSISDTIDSLVRANKAKVLASPSIATLNNTEAKITIGEKFPITEQTQTTTGTTTTTRFVDVGITFTVKPRVGRNGYVTMVIHPEVSSVSATLTAGPRITTRQADTTVMVRTGETAVIAGLVKEDHSEVRGRNPLLSWFPFGYIFRNFARNVEQKELAIFITPYIMDTGGHMEESWRSGLKASEPVEVGERLMGLHYLDRAQRLEDDETGISYGQDGATRWLNAALSYGSMAARFPDHPKTPFALWRQAVIYEEKLKDPAKALEVYQKLDRDFADSPYAKSAPERIQKLKSLIEKKNRRLADNMKTTQKNKKPETAQKQLPVPSAIFVGGKVAS